MDRILVAVDFRPGSDRALRRAALLARDHGCALRLLHVVDDEQPPRLVRNECAAAEEILGDIAATLREHDRLDCDHRVLAGDLPGRIAEAAQDAGADLILLGAHAGAGLRDRFVGTAAERVVRSAGRPVLMAGGVPARAYRHVIATTDLSDCSASVFARLRELELAGDAELSALHVFEMPGGPLLARAGMSPERVVDHLLDETEAAQAKLTQFLDAAGAGAAEKLVIAARTSPARDIGEAAATLRGDLLVVGTRGRSGLDRIMLGSVAAEVLRAAECDVLVIPVSQP